MSARFQFNRMELAGSLGDLGTLLPLAIGMVMVNGMSITGVLFSIGIFYLLAGFYFGVPVPVQPMKAIGAYAVATGMVASQVAASVGLVGLFLFVIGITGTINFVGTLIPKPVIRGVQLSTGLLLMGQGIKMILGKSFQQLAAEMTEPNLTIQAIGPLPIGICFGVLGLITTFFLLKNKKYPAGIVVVFLGVLAGVFWGTHEGFDTIVPGIYFPELLPFGLPRIPDLTVALLVLVLPQLPMTVGNAILANTDLSREYFGEDSRKITYTSTTLSMAFANGLSFLLGGIPLCHGAGGLAAHYSFGARTGGSNVIIGTLFLALALFFGPHALVLINLLPLSILGVLLIFAGSQLGLSILDMFARKDMFVVLIIVGVTLTTNLAWGFLVGVFLAHLLRSDKFSI
ncbi:MAG: putative sulfate/molybdate transporter [Desulforhopalus sp.]